jgi:flagellar biosynthetic protein FliR
MTLAYLFTWLMVFLRTVGVLLQLPLVAGRPIPVVARLGLCVCLTTLIAGIVPVAALPATTWELIGAVASELLVGLALGFVGQMTFAAIEMAGRLLSSEIGVSASPGMGVPEPSNEPMAALVSTFAIVMFFLFGGHLMMIGALAHSFSVVTAGRPGLAPGAAESLIRATSHLIEIGMRMAAPFIAMNFLVNLTFSVLGRVVPKMNPFIISFSLRIVAGLTLLASSGALFASYLYSEFTQTPVRMLQLLSGN